MTRLWFNFMVRPRDVDSFGIIVRVWIRVNVKSCSVLHG